MVLKKKNNTLKIILKNFKIAPFTILIVFSIILITKAEDKNSQPLKYDYESVIADEFNSQNRLNQTLKDMTFYKEEGISSFYGKRFHGRKTSSGVKFDLNKFTCAHKTLPFGSILKITNKNNGLSSLAIINDRGPFIRKRIIDLSQAVASQIDALGIPDVKIETLQFKENTDSTIFRSKYIAFPLIENIQYTSFDNLNILKSSSDFSELMVLLHQLQDINPKIPYCIMLSANDYFFNKDYRTYYLGILLEPNKFAEKL